MTWSATFAGKPSDLTKEIADRDLGPEAHPAEPIKTFITAQVPTGEADANNEFRISASGTHWQSTDGSNRSAGLSVSVSKITT
jgi:hypothetical protein